jgi:hypothetical protein
LIIFWAAVQSVYYVLRNPNFGWSV